MPEDRVSQEELDNCRRSPLYFYNKYIRKDGEPELSLAEYEEKMKSVISTKAVITRRRREIFIIDDTTENNETEEC